MQKNGRTDSPATNTPKRVALIDRATWFAFILSREVITPPPGAAIALNTAAGILAELDASGAHIHVLCRSPESARSTLLGLRQKERTAGASFMLPDVHTDPRCVTLPDAIADRRTLLGCYDQVIVIGLEAVSYHLTRTEPAMVDGAEAPAGAAVVLTA